MPLLLSLFFACATPPAEPAPSPTAPADAGDARTDPPPAEKPEPFSNCGTKDPIELQKGGDAPVRVEGDTLHVDVRHGGGCKEHAYQICWSGLFMESEPVQVDLEIWHDANGDACRALVQEALTFDLTPLKEKWKAGYGPAPGTVTVHLAGETVRYSFED